MDAATVCCCRCRVLYLAHNQLTGTIPESFDSLADLQ